MIHAAHDSLKDTKPASRDCDCDHDPEVRHNLTHHMLVRNGYEAVPVPESQHRRVLRRQLRSDGIALRQVRKLFDENLGLGISAGVMEKICARIYRGVHLMEGRDDDAMVA